MPTTYLIRVLELFVVLLLTLAIFFSWRADRRDRSQLAAELAATKQLLAAADTRQHDRDAQLAQTLAALAAEKRTVVTPAQVIHNLPNQLRLPVPITLEPGPPSVVGATLASPVASAGSPSTGGASPAPTNREKPPQTNAVIPAEDLKPLYDFTIDCKACQSKLTAAHADLADERQKTAALTRERDDALRIARGGSAWRRIRRASKWFLIGAAAGAIAAKSAH